MRATAVIAACLLLVATSASLAVRDEPAVAFSEEERAAILAHGPWPPAFTPDPSNRVSGNPAAIALGRQLFSDTRLSVDGRRACVTCHDPALAYADGRDRSVGLARVDRNAIALANLRLNRWFGWSGAADSLWAQSLRPILDPKELGSSAETVRERLAVDSEITAHYARIFGSALATDPAELVLANTGKALAAFQETITTDRTSFDAFRDALERGDQQAMSGYPVRAQRGLKIFIGKGRCSACHHGANFTNGEFDESACRSSPSPAGWTPGGTSASPSCVRARSTCWGPTAMI
jgi:cytochrome c peroxidase